MPKIVLIAMLLVGLATPLLAQQDTVRARRDSTAKARADSIALVRELERMARDTSPARAPTGPQQGPTNPRLLPDISVVGDLIGDASPDSSTQEGGCRYCLREVELALQAAVDPYFRGEVFIGFDDVEKVTVEQAFIATTSLPYGLEARLGRERLPFGKINLTHRHDLHTIEYPWIIQKFLSTEGLKGTGVYVSKIAAPFGFYQELLLTGNDRLGEPPEDLITADFPNAGVDGLLYTARLRNYWDLSESANLEVSGSAFTAKIERPFAFPAPSVENAVNKRQSMVGADLTYRWRPLQQGLYKSFILQAEFMRQVNERSDDPLFLGPVGDFNGLYVFARYQLTRRLFLGGRYDWLEDPLLAGDPFYAGSGYLEFFPSEFSKLMLAYERIGQSGFDAANRILLQAAFALGPHKPHPF